VKEGQRDTKTKLQREEKRKMACSAANSHRTVIGLVISSGSGMAKGRRKRQKAGERCK
jgi:hypothetical protein